MPQKRVTKPKAKAKAIVEAAGEVTPLAGNDVVNANVLGISVAESAAIQLLPTALEGARLVGKAESEIARVYTKP